MIYLLSVISSLHLSFIKNKKQIGWSLLLIAYLAFLMGAVTPGHSFDTYAYQLIYSWTPGSHRFEPGYMHLSYFFFKLGLPYATFRLSYYAAAMLILWWAVKRFGGNLLTYFSIFAVYPFLVEITQVRNFGMVALVALALSFLKGKQKWEWVVAVLLLILAFNFQASGMLYLLLPFFMFLKGTTIQKIVERGYWILLVITTIIHYFVPVGFANKLVYVAFRIAGRKPSDAFSHFGAGSSFSIAIGYFIFLGLIVYVWKYFINRTPEILDDRRYKVLYSVMTIAVLDILLISSSIDFERYIRDGFTFSLIAFAMYEYEYVNNPRIKRIFWTLMAILLVIGTIVYKYWYPGQTGRLQFVIYLTQFFPNLNW
ncbi:hypothetical protein WGH24286_01583 [Periweissella ghanensis]|uniref:EpsG family protein n=2 Tax=Periweissella ghanensis TaxID=467997 RepID=A0ABM8ZCJ9_9LACO|nr:EpsG family protein [Periweissella ghanensis]CAH0419136.1 hypothetical protein WGH24286_01583 [Periweissella ghanensis]